MDQADTLVCDQQTKTARKKISTLLLSLTDVKPLKTEFSKKDKAQFERPKLSARLLVPCSLVAT